MPSDPSQYAFQAVCRDCSSVADASLDNQICPCGGVFHVDSARCLACGGRHPFTAVGDRCTCGGDIVPKMATCPMCGGHATADHLGGHCGSCKVELRMEG